MPIPLFLGGLRIVGSEARYDLLTPSTWIVTLSDLFRRPPHSLSPNSQTMATTSGSILATPLRVNCAGSRHRSRVTRPSASTSTICCLPSLTLIWMDLTSRSFEAIVVVPAIQGGRAIRASLGLFPYLVEPGSGSAAFEFLRATWPDWVAQGGDLLAKNGSLTSCAACPASFVDPPGSAARSYRCRKRRQASACPSRRHPRRRYA